MIDNEKEAYELIEALNEHLPMRAYAALPLVKGDSPAGRRHPSERCREDRYGAVSGRRRWCCVFNWIAGRQNHPYGVLGLPTYRSDSDDPLARRVQNIPVAAIATS